MKIKERQEPFNVGMGRNMITVVAREWLDWIPSGRKSRRSRSQSRLKNNYPPTCNPLISFSPSLFALDSPLHTHILTRMTYYCLYQLLHLYVFWHSFHFLTQNGTHEAGIKIRSVSSRWPCLVPNLFSPPLFCFHVRLHGTMYMVQYLLFEKNVWYSKKLNSQLDYTDEWYHIYWLCA